jgi:hypothetical protein
MTAIWFSAECFVKDPSNINNTLELDYCELGTTFLYALCWKEAFNPSTTVTSTFQRTGSATSETNNQHSSSQNVVSSTDSVVSSLDDPTTRSTDSTSTQLISTSTRPTYALDSSMSTSAENTESHSMESEPTGTASAKNEEVSQGLQKEGNRIALGVGLGVGVPALIVAIVALVETVRRRRRP